MNLVRWQKVKEVFQAAVECPPSERGNFLADACGGDEELRQQALELLNQAFEDRAGWIIYLNVEPVFDPVRSVPRFVELVGRMKLPK